MKHLYLLLSLFCVSIALCQETSGYYVSTNGKRVEGYFKETNYAWFDELKFKSQDSKEFTHLNFDDVAEYGADGRKFIKETVQIDKSGGTNVGFPANSKDPVFEKKAVFLEVLIDSYASLYVNLEGANKRFFYKVKSNAKPIKQLVYKQYYVSGSTVGANNMFRQQLSIDVLCPNASASKFENISYSQSALEKAFAEFNQCNGFDVKVAEPESDTPTTISYGVIAGVGIASTYGEVPSGFSVVANGMAYFVGGEAIVKVRYSRFSLFGKLLLQKFDGEGNNHRYLVPNTEKNSLSVDITEINVNLGARCTFPVAEKERFFIEASMQFATPVSNTMTATFTQYTGSTLNGTSSYVLKPKSNIWLNLGAGAWITKKIALGVYYTPGRSLFVANDFRSTTVIGGLKYILK
ncbi:MAG: hypothetical protein ACOVRN_15980 [Flavobacterium sp.]